MKTQYKLKAVSAAVVLGLAAAAVAGSVSAQVVVGGGATLPQKLYGDILTPKTDWSYTGTGSGAGKKAFLSNNPQATAGRHFKKNYQGGDGSDWPTTQSVHFAGSDSALTQGEFDDYELDFQEDLGRIIQVPAVATSVTLPYKVGSVNNLSLSRQNVCDIFSGAKTTWNQINTSLPGTTIKVVYRTESSGTTELLSNYLVAACGSGFQKSSTFLTVVAATPAAVKANWVGKTESQGIVDGVAETADSIGYVSPDYTIAGIPDTNTVAINAVVAKVENSLPTQNAIQSALASQSLPLIGTADAENPVEWVPEYALPSSGYPIFGTTNLLVSQCYDDTAVQTKVAGFLSNLYNTTTFNANIAAHAFIQLPPSWKTAINNAFLDSNSALSIGKTDVCNSVGRP